MRLPARLFGPLIAFLVLAAPAQAQRLQPPATGGIAELDQTLRRLGHLKRVLVIGAHPDDEDTELLTVLTRAEGAEAAYLSLTRGEGGQNLIGDELGDPLGLLRTEELLAARELDGARQFFSRAYDFGYTKNLDDTWAHWPRDSVLKDVVRIVRRFRPQVIVSVFSGTARDGHGQHQAAGWAAHEAFSAAADASRFPELAREEGLEAWQPQRLYRSARFDTAATTLTLAGGVLDPAEGRTYHQIAMRSRSLHRSQDMGQLQRIGPSRVRLALVEDRARGGGEGLFAGLDTTAAALAVGHTGGSAGTGSGAARPAELARFAQLADSARSVLGPGRMAEVRRALLAARVALLSGLGAAHDDGTHVHATGLSVAAADQLRRIDEALAVAGRVVVDALAADDRIAAGESVALVLQAWNGSSDTVSVTPALVTAWRRDPGDLETRVVPPGTTAEWRVDVGVPPGTRPTAPYFVRAEGEAVYAPAPGTAPAVLGLPFGPPPIVARFVVDPPEPGRYTISREASLRINDQASGEQRYPVTVVPPVEVRVEPEAEFRALDDTTAHRVSVTVVNRSRDSVRGRVLLEPPAGWTAPPPSPLALGGGDDRATFAFALRPPAGVPAGRYVVRGIVETEAGARYALGIGTVEYPHVRVRSYLAPAELAVTAAPLELPELARVGYVRGAADRVPEALRAIGLPVEVIDGAALARADLARYDAIVVGPRAYEVDSNLVEHHRRLLSYAERGGLVIVQYQQYAFFEGAFAPYPLEIAPRHDRVADETVPVTMLRPDHPAMRSPNPIGPADWEGWVQERGLYLPRAWDERYTPLLEMHDPGERPLHGALLVAPVGRGTWVYTGLSFFRELPAGVPGAYRLFANLLGLAEARSGP